MSRKNKSRPVRQSRKPRVQAMPRRAPNRMPAVAMSCTDSAAFPAPKFGLPVGCASFWPRPVARKCNLPRSAYSAYSHIPHSGCDFASRMRTL